MRLNIAHPVEIRYSTLIKATVALLMFLAFLLYNVVRVGQDRTRLNFAPKSALKAQGKEFYLDGKPIRILSGAMHYFRIVPEYWEDRLQKAKEMGLNTIETYVAWNVHEPNNGTRPDRFRFTGNYDLKKYILLAQKVGLHVIVRPGPYICSEWDFGGLPSWLLSDPKMEIRSTYSGFMQAVERYFDALMPILVPLQHSNGGPVIAFQVENEYGSYGNSVAYMTALKKAFTSRGIHELLFTSDNIQGISKDLLPGVLKTVNFQIDVEKHIGLLETVQPDKPAMVMEFWSGWFDHFGEYHHVVSPEKTAETAAEILRRGASINFYMFHGGTNFGFMNGANDFGEYKADVTSYDYDSPLSESGDITKKYRLLREVLKEYTTLPEENLHPLSPPIPKQAYGQVRMTHKLSLKHMMIYLKSFQDSHPVSMEMLPLINNGAQGYGFIIYHIFLTSQAGTLTIHNARDYGVVLLDNVPVQTLEMNKDEHTITIPHSKNARRLDILIENMGRVNYHAAMMNQRKGILGKVLFNKKELKGWDMYSLSFPKVYLDSLEHAKNWDADIPSKYSGPMLFRGELGIKDTPKADTFLSLQGWNKCTCFINGRNLGRYWNIGPQKALYIPAPWLKKGKNIVSIFEMHSSGVKPVVEFVDSPMLGEQEEFEMS